MAFISKKTANILGLAIPIAVAFLIGIQKKIDLGSWTKILPDVIGAINTLTAFFLLIGLYFIKKKQIYYHKISMLVSTTLGALFLVLYILYHISNPSTPFGGEGLIRPIYYFILISHIVLSIVVVRFVLLALYHAIENNFIEHKKVTKIAYPIWLYVSISGVLVYILIKPYYI